MANIFEEHESEVRSYCRKYPVVFSKAKNAEMFDEDGGRYIDFLSVAGSITIRLLRKLYWIILLRITLSTHLICIQRQRGIL